MGTEKCVPALVPLSKSLPAPFPLFLSPSLCPCPSVPVLLSLGCPCPCANLETRLYTRLTMGDAKNAVWKRNYKTDYEYQYPTMKFQFPKCDCDCCCAMSHMTECRTLWGKRMCLILFTGHQSKTCGRGHSDQGSRVPSFWLDAPPSMPVMQVSWHQEDWQFSHASRHYTD